MITTLLFDFSRVLLHPKDKNYTEGLNKLYREQKGKPGFQFFDFFELNEALLQFLETIKDHVALDIFTTDTIQDAPEVKKRIDSIFKNIFSANQLGLDKKKHASYMQLLEKLGAKPEHVLFIDDTQDNLDFAAKAGLRTFHFQGNAELIQKIRTFL